MSGEMKLVAISILVAWFSSLSHAREQIVPKVKWQTRSCYRRTQTCCYKYEKCGYKCHTGYCSHTSFCTHKKFGRCFRWKSLKTCQERCFTKMCAIFECNSLGLIRSAQYVFPQIHTKVYYPQGKGPPKVTPFPSPSRTPRPRRPRPTPPSRPSKRPSRPPRRTKQPKRPPRRTKAPTRPPIRPTRPPSTNQPSRLEQCTPGLCAREGRDFKCRLFDPMRGMDNTDCAEFLRGTTVAPPTLGPRSGRLARARRSRRPQRRQRQQFAF